MPAIALAACIVAPVPRAVAALGAGNWDVSAQHVVVGAGLMSNLGSGFAGAEPLSAPEANAAMVALEPTLAPVLIGAEQQLRWAGAGSQAEPTAPTETPQSSEPGQAGERAPPTEQGMGAGATPGNRQTAAVQIATGQSPSPAHTARSPVALTDFDAMLTAELGLGGVAAHVQSVARSAGLDPPTYFGSEVVTRFLELDYEHPVGTQRFDLFPQSPVTRATAAWSLSRAMSLSDWEIAQARQSLGAFQLPAMTAAQRQALGIAVSRIGYPYVWGGTTDDTLDGLEHGGFDCSGFAWRVYKLSGLPWGRQILGRTAAEQAREIPMSRRLRAGQLQPGDLLFFGSAHFHSRATEQNVIHEGIYLGDNWVIHSSGQGVYVLPLQGSWLGSQFAWGRRVID